MSENKDTRTATQKIEDLEKVLTMVYQAVAQNKPVLDSLIKSRANSDNDMALVKETLKLLNRKSEATIQAANPESGITAESVSAIVTKMAVEELTAQVASYVANGYIVPADAVSDKSYLVAEELAADGTLANPRVQFRVDTQDSTIISALAGKLVGDVVKVGEGKYDLKILEIYTLVDPTPAQEETVSAAESAGTETAPEATTDSEAAPATNASGTGPSNEALAPPTESPVTEFVPSQAGAMATA